MTTLAEWRAQVEKELGSTSFEKALITKTLDGLAVEPLYVAATQVHQIQMPARFQICMRQGSSPGESLWLSPAQLTELKALPPHLIVDGLQAIDVSATVRFARAIVVDQTTLSELQRLAQANVARFPLGKLAMVSTIDDHLAGAEAVDELACALSSLTACWKAMEQGGLDLERGAQQLAVQLSVGRETFLELCKLRAMRVLWGKLLAAAGVRQAVPLVLHAVCSRRTLSQRDPWVNMLRTTTQMFAAILGGADFITPTTFDDALGATSSLAQRVAFNTGLILREESALGQVVDPAQGAYFFESTTDQLARAAWARFQELERAGGIATMRANGQWAARLESAWQARRDALAKRRLGVLGVSEFPNLNEESLGVPGAPERGHRDSEPFETLRSRVEQLTPAPEVLLLCLGSFAESRARVGFASQFFASGGLHTKEVASPEKASLVCLCGTDERYATEAVDAVQQLKALGCDKVMLAGRPGALEAPLKAAGLHDAIFLGCDVVSVITRALELPV